MIEDCDAFILRNREAIDNYPDLLLGIVDAELKEEKATKQLPIK